MKKTMKAREKYDMIKHISKKWGLQRGVLSYVFK